MKSSFQTFQIFNLFKILTRSHIKININIVWEIQFIIVKEYVLFQMQKMEAVINEEILKL